MKGLNGEVFSTWLVAALKWGVPAAAFNAVVVAVLLLLRNEPTFDLDMALGLVMIALLGAFIAVPFMVMGGVVAGITAVITTRLFVPIRNERRYSAITRVVVGIATTATVVSTVLGTLFEQGEWRFFDTATRTDVAIWFGPVVVITFGAVWLAGRQAVAHSLRFMADSV